MKEEEKISKERKKKIDRKANARKIITGQKKKRKPSRPAKKVTGKKPSKKSTTKKPVNPRRSDGSLDMRYQVNRDYAKKLEKQRKAREKKKREAQKAEQERIRKYQAAAKKRKATIAAKNKARIEEQIMRAGKRSSAGTYKIRRKK